VRPAAAECDPALPQGHHNFGMQIGMLDGSVRSLAASTSPVTWATMTNPTSNNPPGPF
jgi:prepilin-type processing-associated H-X9-DG protein